MAKKRKIGLNSLKGITLHNGFLGDETLFQLSEELQQNGQLQTLINDKLRSFRENYLEFARTSQKLRSKNRIKDLQELTQQWIKNTISYLGYTEFEATAVKHWEEGNVPCLLPKEESHSVAVFVAASATDPHDAFETGPVLTDLDGESPFESSKKESLAEQVEKVLPLTQLGEAILILPHAAYYFRADSAVSQSCLECRWDEMMGGDHDLAISMASYLLRESFFKLASEDEAQEEETLNDTEEEHTEAVAQESTTTASSRLFKENLEQSRRITEQLHAQVVLALELIINERLNLGPDLRKQARSKTLNDKLAKDLFKDGLFVLYRLLFVLFAEARKFLPVQNEKFSSFYSLEHFRDWAEEYLRKESRGEANPDGTYLWGGIQTLFTLLRRGAELPGGEIVSPFNGQLFAPDRAPLFDSGPALRDQAMAHALVALTRAGSQSSGQRLHFGNLGIEQLGAVYEALLAQKPTLVRENSIWVPAHPKGIALVTESLADAMDMDRFDEEPKAGSKKKRRKTSKGAVENFIDPRRPAFHPSIGTFIVAPLGGTRRQTAAYYTPPKLAAYLVWRTLKPLAEGKSSKEILDLKVLEPAMGSGSFLIQVVRYLGKQLLQARIKERAIELRKGDKPTYRDEQRCKREVVENCIYGVDMNPLAIELARTSLYLETIVPGEPLPFLHHRLKAGNSLIGADFQNRAQSEWEEGQKFPAIFDIPLDALKHDKKLFKSWDNAYGDKIKSKELQTIIKEKHKELKKERKAIGAETWCAWANTMQEKLNHFLQLAAEAQNTFEKAQCSDEVIAELDERHKDQLLFVPDLDPVIIEAYGVEVDNKLQRSRRKTLIQEHGRKNYTRIVERQRAFTRARALGDLHIGLWYWPVDQFNHFPSLKNYQELCKWLIDDVNINPQTPTKPLAPTLIKTLRIALRRSQEVGAFQWEVEYAPVFADPARLGFSALISNPPWKLVGVKDSDIYPTFDPQFLEAKPSQKNARARLLANTCPQVPADWYRQEIYTTQLSRHFHSGEVSCLPAEGKGDLSCFFSLRSEFLLCQKGRAGLILSHGAIFASKATKALRRRFFGQWGLQEAITFKNELELFAIPKHIEFSLLVGEISSGAVCEPKFAYGVTDPAELGPIGGAMDHNEPRYFPHAPVEISDRVIVNLFSPETFAIPGISNPRQLELVEAINSKPKENISLDAIFAKVCVGINKTEGPKKGLSSYTEDISSKEIPNWTEVLAGKQCSWVPVFRGSDFDLFNPAKESSPCFEQYAHRDKLIECGVDLNKPTLCWRAICQPITNQRTLLVAVLPPNTWVNHNVFTVQGPSLTDLFYLAALLGGLPNEFLCRMFSGAYQSEKKIKSLPLAAYHTWALDEAASRVAELHRDVFKHTALAGELGQKQRTADRLVLQAEIDALTWLHFGNNIKPLDEESLEWALGTQFSLLNRKKPEYKELVLAAFKRFAVTKKESRLPAKSIFDRKSRKDIARVVGLPTQDRRTALKDRRSGQKDVDAENRSRKRRAADR